MITNVPDAEEMKQTALWLFFNAWEQILGIIELALAEEFGSTIVKGHIEPSTEFKDEIEQFINEVQPELRLAYVLLQQKPRAGAQSKNLRGQPIPFVLGIGRALMGKDQCRFFRISYTGRRRPDPGCKCGLFYATKQQIQIVLRISSW